MNLLDQIVINRPKQSQAEIQLLQGDIGNLPPEHAIDILVVSAYPGNYTPLPGTLLSALYDKGVDIAALAKNMQTDLREEMGCWLSQPLTPEQQARVHFKQVLCFEPRSQKQQIATATAENELLKEPATQDLNPEEWWNMMAVKNNAKDQALQFRYTTGRGNENQWESVGLPMLATILIKEKSGSTYWDKASGQTLFELMIPLQFREKLATANSISWLVNKDTACYPWEMMQLKEDHLPISIRAGMIRQLSDGNIRRSAASGKKQALVLGDPQLQQFLDQLPAAVTEAVQATRRLRDNNYACDESVNDTASDVLTKLFSTEYNVIHFSGYGWYNETEPEKSGLLLGNNAFLTIAEIAQLPTTPELVFVNTGLRNSDVLPKPGYDDNRNKLAALLGTQLIQLGVKAVVITGWLVDEKAALDFTSVFYEQLLQGASFWKASLEARKSVFEKHKNQNTWGAYQCYGDPFYTLVNKPFEQEQEVGNIFQCINTFAFSKNNNVIAMPVLASGNQGVALEKMLPALIDRSIFWLEKGLPLQCIKMILFSSGQAEKALPIFSRAKQQNQVKTGLLQGLLTATQAVEQVATIKTQLLPGEESLPIVSSEINRLAPQQLGQPETISNLPLQGGYRPAAGTTPNQPAQEIQYDFFISYSHKHSAVVDEFVSTLTRKNTGLKIFYDKTTIEPGGLWIKDISDAIERSKKVLVFLSPDYTNSKICWAEYQCAQLKEFNDNTAIISTIYLYSTKIPLIMGIRSFINCREADKEQLVKAALQLSSLQSGQ